LPGSLSVQALLETGCVTTDDLASDTEQPVTLDGTVAEAAGAVFLEQMLRIADETDLDSDAHVVFSLWNTDAWTGGVVAAYHMGLDLSEQSETAQMAGCYESSCANGSADGRGFDLTPYIEACGLQ
jgi:hypothetical protein